MSETPLTLTTKRLTLRQRTLDDFPFFVSLWGKPAVTRYICGAALSEEQTWSKFLRMIGHWQIMGFGYWAIETRANDQTSGDPKPTLIGEAGFGDFKREMTPSIRGELEIGWVIDPEYAGQGYASEAVTAITAWGNAYFPEKRQSCIIDPNHAASIRVAEKCGFMHTARTIYEDQEALIFHRLHS